MKDITKYATKEESKLFYKIYNANAEDVYAFFGEQKEKLLNDFVTVWNDKRLSDVLKNSYDIAMSDPKIRELINK